jgi:hypothetical protein
MRVWRDSVSSIFTNEPTTQSFRRDSLKNEKLNKNPRVQIKPLVKLTDEQMAKVTAGTFICSKTDTDADCQALRVYVITPRLLVIQI